MGIWEHDCIGSAILQSTGREPVDKLAQGVRRLAPAALTRRLVVPPMLAGI
jgi:hypothetical protein